MSDLYCDSVEKSRPNLPGDAQTTLEAVTTIFFVELYSRVQSTIAWMDRMVSCSTHAKLYRLPQQTKSRHTCTPLPREQVPHRKSTSRQTHAARLLGVRFPCLVLAKQQVIYGKLPYLLFARAQHLGCEGCLCHDTRVARGTSVTRRSLTSVDEIRMYTGFVC